MECTVADVVDQPTRSRMMSGIRGKNTKPELIVRHALHRRGFRYRLHDKGLPGKPDLVLPKFRAVIFVNGCFWHGHTCHLAKSPTQNAQFWQKKISDNQARDERSHASLLAAGWRVMVIWECALKGAKQRAKLGEITDQAEAWLRASNPSDYMEISGD